MAERYIAILKWMGGDHGYGFMVDIEGKEVMVHYEPILGEGYRVLMEGDKCAFGVGPGRKGLTATNVYQPDVTPPRRYDRT